MSVRLLVVKTQALLERLAVRLVKAELAQIGLPKIVFWGPSALWLLGAEPHEPEVGDLAAFPVGVVVVAHADPRDDSGANTCRNWRSVLKAPARRS